MKEVTVNREELLTILNENRDNHRGVYEKAIEGYKEQMRKELEEYLKRVEDDEVIDVRIFLPAPKDYTSEYDRVIRMVEMSIHDEIQLSQTEFSQYVMDDWGWKAEWIGSVQTYTDVEY